MWPAVRPASSPGALSRSSLTRFYWFRGLFALDVGMRKASGGAPGSLVGIAHPDVGELVDRARGALHVAARVHSGAALAGL